MVDGHNKTDGFAARLIKTHATALVKSDKEKLEDEKKAKIMAIKKMKSLFIFSRSHPVRKFCLIFTNH